MLNQVQRQRYEKVYYQLHAALTACWEGAG